VRERERLYKGRWIVTSHCAADIKNPVLEDINELINELQTIYHDVAAQALDHIHAKYAQETCAHTHTRAHTQYSVLHT
jgi:hypothetical protein